jgi:hypothetical protein
LALLTACGVLAAGALTACGGDSGSDATSEGEGAAEEAIESSDIPGDAAHEDVAVIAGWVDTLREGDVEGAAEYFAIPSIAVNGGLRLRIRSTGDAVAFNESLPCGAELVGAEGTGDAVVATFRLTERPGPGRCGEGTGGLAMTRFEIEDGKIAEWRRVGESGPQAEGQAV